MGKRSSRRKNTPIFESDDDSISTTSTSASDITQSHESEELFGREYLLENYLNALYEKRGSTREKALAGIIDVLTTQMQFECARNNCVTLQHLLAKSIKRGSATEAALASQALGLLAINVGAGGCAHELMEESLSHISQALKSGPSSPKNSSVLECLAIITFVGGNEFDETQRSMQMIWQIIHPKPGSNVGAASKPGGDLLERAVSAWSFLLTTIDVQRTNATEWQGYVSYLTTLLEKDDRAVRMAAGEAVALLFEKRNLEKQFTLLKNVDAGSTDERNSGVFLHVEALKGKILNQVQNLSAEAGGKGSGKKDLSSQRNLFRDIQMFFETGHCSETSIKLQFGDLLMISSWSDRVQVNFLRHFLGAGFLKHMQENELLHDIFNFNPKKQIGRHEDQFDYWSKRMLKSSKSAVSKARSQFLNKQRMLAQGRNYATIMTDE